MLTQSLQDLQLNRETVCDSFGQGLVGDLMGRFRTTPGDAGSMKLVEPTGTMAWLRNFQSENGAGQQHRRGNGDGWITKGAPGLDACSETCETRHFVFYWLGVGCWFVHFVHVSRPSASKSAGMDKLSQ
jgi:hypothetical protein